MGMGQGGVINFQPFDPDQMDTRVALERTEAWLIIHDVLIDDQP
jgi:hypothetical protein